MIDKVKYYIKKLGLKNHPEGGYFKEYYRSDEIILKKYMPKRYTGNRNISTSIYFLLDEENISRFHKLNSDEIWHFYDGTAIKIYTINNYGKLSVILLGRNQEKGELFQAVIKKGNWFCAEIVNKKSFALVGCTVAPGFDFADFILAERKQLIEKFPDCIELINRFTKE